MTESIFRLEDANPEDVKTLRSIVRDAWLALYPNEEYGITEKDIAEIDWYNLEGLERRRKEIIENTGTIHTFVMKNPENAVVGFCKVSKQETYGKVDGMYISKEFQGKGLGRKLMEKALDWLGKTDIKLRVVVYNVNAINFYKKMGFKEAGKVVTYEGTPLPSGKKIPRIEMVRV